MARVEPLILGSEVESSTEWPKFYLTLSPGACIIKLIMAIIYGFRNKLECLSLESLSSQVYCLVTNTLAYYGNCTLRPK